MEDFYKFLKEEGFEFCYLDEKPILLNPMIHRSVIEKYFKMKKK